MKLKALLIGLSLLFIQMNSVAYASLPSDVTGNDYLSECMTHKELLKQVIQERENETKGLGLNYDLQEKVIWCTTAAVVAYRAVTQVAYPWGGINPICYIDYYGNFTPLQLSDLLLKYIADHPKTRQLSIGIQMMGMLHDYYPTPKQCLLQNKQKHEV